MDIKERQNGHNLWYHNACGLFREVTQQVTKIARDIRAGEVLTKRQYNYNKLLLKKIVRHHRLTCLLIMRLKPLILHDSRFVIKTIYYILN